jgi:hypothetical protein
MRFVPLKTAEQQAALMMHRARDLTSLLGRKPRLVAAVALANKTACVAWAIMSRQDIYRRAAVAA